MTQPETPESMDEILARAQRGDDAAKERLFHSCRHYLRGIAQEEARSWFKAKVDASDLVQQTMLDACRDFEEFRGVGDEQLRAWLRTILTRNATDVARAYGTTEKRRVSRERSLTADTDESTDRGLEPNDPGDTPSRWMMRQEDEEQLALALTGLSEPHREVIRLRNLQRLSFAEIAERMGRTRPAVQMLWMRALRQLESLMPES
ncbi:RNA polymerase sigma factor YlaC [Planctomycetes bacterium Pan216]|uniref:RNA polymerase sigma factor YlaC n=1 Tax=Kolteria novifilia TaxID=2527975 RepID=A0A518AX20_9BACT|nr:RNA polymerase sigma factor YlaC [Planctomycetes bacterium Pan216]